MSQNVSWDEQGNWGAAGAWGSRDSAGRKLDLAHWQVRLDALRAKHHVPGASLALLVDGTVHELASGVLHTGTGVEVTTDSVFQMGSIAKVYTATLIMQLAESGVLDLDAPVVDVLPEFSVAGPAATRAITIRRLLSHTGGLTCDFTHDSGRGDDCLARYVEAAKGVALDCPPGTAISYSSVGYNVLGRIIEVVTGKVWDQALKDLLLTPLGLTHTMTLPEEALRFRAAMGHLGEPGRMPDPAPEWDMMPRSAGPYGRVIASAGDLARLARMHLAGGVAEDGTRVLSAETAALMQRRVVDCPDKWTVSSDGWGLGWTLYDWNGVPGYGHDGASIGQYGYLRVVPSAGVAVALLTNGGGAREVYAALYRELLAELAGVTMPEPFAPPARPPVVDFAPLVGTYRREGVVITVTERDGAGHVRYAFVDGMKDFSDPLEIDLLPVTETVFAGTGVGAAFSEDYMPVVFSTLPDGTGCVYIGMRCGPKTA
ncbi:MULTISPECIES: serine hydrolase domain-containing protein [Actinomycetes]|uniref:Beta-lactamase family protein n=2 Tax=Streptomyces rimosus subsp. rimosus TaxID=132474 RepID=L8EW46_STRR1|nr:MULTISPECIES: serine hydrolase domain-containing protein [Streptomyces]KOG83783.1 penicillin-binding protein [Kitasatospora aureofaciens]MYT42740.1 serine hydrolase [Streptomyces sp. SID5471]KEF07234.1 penicillin-binding protein [Streptomyces rimosus]KEF19566.1 penicillin-binding protein [Streptomyces rimosus]KOT27240.1 penicillin-binding protein [Streptomyces rimosus subsp. rimosus]